MMVGGDAWGAAAWDRGDSPTGFIGGRVGGARPRCPADETGKSEILA